MSNKNKRSIDNDLQVKMGPNDPGSRFDADIDKKDLEEVEHNDKKSDLPKEIKDKSIDQLQYYFGNRELEPFDNSDILRCRLLYQIKISKKPYCSYIINRKNKKKIGVVSNMQLRHSWRMAHSKDAKKAVKNDLFFMTYTEWENDFKALENYIRKKKSLGSKSILYFSDVWDLSEIEYESAGLKKPQQFMALLQTAILGEIEENKRTVRAWRRIRKYLYRVHLEKSKGGIFSEEDAEKIRAAFKKIKYLNDIRKYNIYLLKNVGLDFDFAKIVKDINKAYKEDMARRRDRRYKVRPFISAFINLALVLCLGYALKYQLLYNTVATVVIMTLFTICVLDALFIVFAGLRGRRRRLVRPDYVYYSNRVKKSIGAFAFIGIFAVMSIFVFYQRYDGYTDDYYFRETDDGEIVIAGLVNKNRKKIDIPETIEGKPVVEIDLYAFDNEYITSVKLPETLKKIDTSAFAGCYSLSHISIPSSVEEIGDFAFNNSGIVTLSLQNHGKIYVGDRAFKNCYKLKTVENSEIISNIGDQAFSGCSNLNSIAFSIQLASIGRRAFYGCSSITSIDVPPTIGTIGRGAFYGCNALKSITVPFAGTSKDTSEKESIGSIIRIDSEENEDVSVVLNSSAPVSSKAFRNVDWIRSVHLHDDTPEIKGSAFAGADNLAEIKLPLSTKEIDSYMFYGATSLSSISGMGGVTKIGDRAFAGCSSLSYVDLSSVEIIGKEAFSGTRISTLTLASDRDVIIADKAFKNCENMTRIENSQSIVSIGDQAFSGCSDLWNISFSDKLESIGNKAFYGCSSITSIYIPSSTKSIGRGAFYGCNSLGSISIPFIGTSADNSDRASIGSVFKIDSVNYFNSGVAVTINTPTDIGKNAFKNIDWIESVNLHDDISNIDPGAFSGMSNLVDIRLPAAITEISGNMFKGSTSLKTISGMSGVKKIGERAFYECKSLESIDLSSVEIIGSEAFSNCTHLENIGSLSSLESIGANAFNSCYDLTVDLYIYPSLKNVDDYAFANSYFTNITFSSGVKEIGAHAFENCSRIESVYLPATVTALGDYAFSGCGNLKSVDLFDSSIKSLGKYAFRNCYKLSEIYLPSQVTEISDGLFYGCSDIQNLSAIKNFEQITAIGDSAFEACGMDYVDLSIPGRIKRIGDRAFAKTGILTLTIDSGVTTIGQEAFSKCKNLTSVTISNSVNAIGKAAFDECGSIGNVTLPFLGEKRSDTSKSFMGLSKNGGYDWVFGETKAAKITITGMTTIYTNTFAGGESAVENVVINSSASTIEKSAFEGFVNLRSITLPASVSSIGEKAFKNCSSLKSIDIPSKVETISKSMFENCYNLDIDISALTVKTIESRAFYGCSKIGNNSVFYGVKAIEFNQNLEKIESYAFANCYEIDGVILTYHIKELDVNAFGMFPDITIYVFEDSLLVKYQDLFKVYNSVEVKSFFE